MIVALTVRRTSTSFLGMYVPARIIFIGKEKYMRIEGATAASYIRFRAQQKQKQKPETTNGIVVKRRYNYIPLNCVTS